MTNQTSVRVKKISLLAPDVLQVILAPGRLSPLDFQAGQYIGILHDGTERYFSLANAPRESGELELHIRRLHGNDFTAYVFGALAIGDELEIKGPFGMFTPQQHNTRRLVFVAGGTGFAPIKSFIEHHLEKATRHGITLYRGARTKEDLYLDELCRHWQQQRMIEYIPVLSDAGDDAGWAGRKGLVHEAVIKDQAQPGDCEVYACGPPAMITALRNALLSRGLPPGQFHSEGG